MPAMQALLTIAATLTLLVASDGPARAERPDCDAARAKVQAQLDTACPCAAAESHGRYVRCVARQLRELSGCETGTDGRRKCGPVPRACMGKIRRLAGGSTCGRPEAVPCCLPRQRDCVGDEQSGDGKADGRCNGTKRPCDSIADCLVSKCQVATSADRCRAAGGTPGTGTRCRTACP